MKRYVDGVPMTLLTRIPLFDSCSRGREIRIEHEVRGIVLQWCRYVKGQACKWCLIVRKL